MTDQPAPDPLEAVVVHLIESINVEHFHRHITDAARDRLLADLGSLDAQDTADPADGLTDDDRETLHPLHVSPCPASWWGDARATDCTCGVFAAVEAILAARQRPTRQADTDRAVVLPFTLRMPTNRADNPEGEELNTGVNHTDVQVILDPDMALRGECRNGYGGPVIALREWDEQVLLHELLHAATGYAQPLLATTYPPHGHEVISRIEVALWETGWRMSRLPGDDRVRTQGEDTPVDAALLAVEGAVPGGNTRTPAEWPERQPTLPERLPAQDTDRAAVEAVADVALAAYAEHERIRCNFGTGGALAQCGCVCGEVLTMCRPSIHAKHRRERVIAAIAAASEPISGHHEDGAGT